MPTQPVPELDVQIGVVNWLVTNGWTIESISVCHGQGIDSANSKNMLKGLLVELGMNEKAINFVSKGEDIRARREGILWRIECKGLGSGKPSTDKENFDRAIASAVSYYTKPYGLRVGLALPDDTIYKKLLHNKISKPLRLAINLWIFLYVARSEIYEFAPHEDLPF